MAKTSESSSKELPAEKPAWRPPAPEAADAGQAGRAGMLRAAGLMSFMTVVSRILGLWRDRLMAGLFGATGINDAFNLAFLLPNMTRRLFGEGALSSAFVPVFTARLAVKKHAAAFRTASVLLSRLSFGLFAASALFVLCAHLARMLGQPSTNTALTLELAEVMIGYCVLINVAAVLMGVLNALGHFFAPALAPVLLNVCMIAACLWGGDLFGARKEDHILTVSFAVLAGGLLQLAVLIPPLLGNGFRFRPSLDLTDEGYRDVMKGFFPVILGVALFQINLLLDQVIARVFIPEDGPVTMLAYGNRLIQLPWAIFSLSLATAALPMLSRLWAEERKEDFARAVSSAARNTLYLALPSTVGLCLLSTDLTRLFYGTGEFLSHDGEAVVRTGRVVFYFSLGLCFYSLNAILARALYATLDTQAPKRAALAAVAVNLALNLLLVLGPRLSAWRAQGLPELKESGLALASAISGAVQTVLMARALYARLGGPDARRLSGFIRALLLGGGVGLGGAWAAYWKLSQYPNLEGFISFLAACAIALLSLWFFGDAYFSAQLQRPSLSARLFGAAPARDPSSPDSSTARYEVPENRWPPDLVFYHSLYTTAVCCTFMGLLVWSVRDSLPPEGDTFALVFQRAVVPVAAGVAVYLLASSGFQSREYEELRAAFSKRTRSEK